MKTPFNEYREDNGMRTISIYSRPYINVESEGIIYACQIYGEDSDTPYFFFDGARHELTDEEKEALKCRM